MSVRSFFIDTNIFLRPVVKDNKKHAQECERVFLSLQKGMIQAITSSVVLAEFTWTCLRFYALSKQEVIALERGIISLKNLKVTDNFNNALALDYFEHYPVKYIDALIASHVAVQHHLIPILSYDKDFDRMNITRVTPHEIVDSL